MNLILISFFSGPEPQILDYVTQQHKLFPLIATCFAIHYSAAWIWDMYNNVTEDINKGQLDNLPEVITFTYTNPCSTVYWNAPYFSCTLYLVA